MALTECPDCGGVVSDAALTCPTCHRVLRSIDPEGVKIARGWITWFALGALTVFLVILLVKGLA